MFYMYIVSNQLAVTNTNCQEHLYWGINCIRYYSDRPGSEIFLIKCKY